MTIPASAAHTPTVRSFTLVVFAAHQRLPAQACEYEVVSDTVLSERRGDVWVVTIDDGKANALSPAVIDALGQSLDEAHEASAKAVLIAGRTGMLTGGFDLSIMRGADLAAIGDLVTSGGEFMVRLYSSSIPIVCACTGHAVAAGALLLLSSHYRVGAEGTINIGLIEAAIGMVLPDWAVVLADERLSRRHYQQATIEGRTYRPAEAKDAGFLDTVVPADRVLDAAFAEAERLAAAPQPAYGGNAQKVRGPAVERLRQILQQDRRQVDELKSQ